MPNWRNFFFTDTCWTGFSLYIFYVNVIFLDVYMLNNSALQMSLNYIIVSTFFIQSKYFKAAPVLLWSCASSLYCQCIFFGDRCLQCYTLPIITFCLSLLNAIAGYFVFRWFGKWRLINFKGKAPTTPISWENKVLEAG